MDVPTVVVTLVLAIILLLVLLSIINGTIPGVKKINNCGDRGGRCVTKAYGVGCGVGSYAQPDLKGCTEAEMCCLPTEKQPGQVQTQFTVKEQAAIKNGVIVALNDVPTPLSQGVNIPLKVSQEYTFNINVNDELRNSASKIGYECAVYITDSNDRGRKYVLNGGIGLQEPTGNAGGNYADEIFYCDPGESLSRTYTPSPLDAYKSLTLYVILLDKNASDAFTNRIGPPAPGETLPDFTSMYSNTQHWLAWKAFKLNVEPVIKISGMNTDWTAKDQLTISCNGISCDSIELRLVKQGEGTYNDLLINDCSQPSDLFKSSLEYVSGTTVQSSGIPLNIDIGGFRIPYQQRLLYVTNSRPISVSANKADITIDKATMIRTFAGTNSDLLLEDKTFLCVRARKAGTAANPVYYYGMSETPIKVDALPPVVDVDSGIQVVFPDPITSMNASTPYYYRQYPRIVVSGCYDWGQSGCTNYDYYIKVGNFINLNSNTADWQSGLVGLLLTEGVNSLITYFASRDAANTICPLMTSNGYMRNTNPEIRFMGAGQAIVCIRLGDKVGNTRLVWKPIWSPAEMLNRVLVSALT